MSKDRVFLIVTASRKVRVLKRLPWDLALDEVAIPVDLVFPDGWGSVIGPALTVNVPNSVPAVQLAPMKTCEICGKATSRPPLCERHWQGAHDAPTA